MASFSDKLKEAQSVSTASTFTLRKAVVEEPAVMTLSLEDEEIAAYAGDDEDWIKSTNATYRYTKEYHDDSYSTVDEEKNINLDPKQINLTQEKNSQYIPFRMNRFYDGFDLSTTTITFYWVNERGAGGTTPPVDVYYNEDKIKFALLVDDDMTSLAGKVNFEIHAEGTNSLGEGYLWKTKPNNNFNVLQALEIKQFIEPDETWQETFIGKVEAQAKRAEAAVAEAIAAKNEAVAAKNDAASIVAELQNGIADEVGQILSENYYTVDMTHQYVSGRLGELKNEDGEDVTVKDYVAQEIANADIEGKLEAYAKTDNVKAMIGEIGEKTVVQYIDDAVDSVDISDQLGELDGKTVAQYVDDAVAAIDVSDELGNLVDSEGNKLTVEEYVQQEVASVDVTEQLADYAKSSDVYTKVQTYNKEEIDNKVSNVEVDLTGYATETFVNEKVTPINTAITSINQTLEGIDKSPRVTYKATYGDVELPDGSTGEYMFTLWKNEGNGDEVQDRFQILGGGGGSGSGVVMRIAYVDGYGTPFVTTVDDKVILKYDFSGEDSAGDTNLDGIASWKVGSRVVKTQDVSTGVNEFDLTEYVNVGDNKILLTITHATGAIATKAWTIKVVDVRLVKSFDDTRKYPANSPINYTFVPYGGVEKTVHFILDGEEIGTKTSLAASSGLSDSYDIPAHGHGTHLLEVYMTAKVNDKDDVESNHIMSDIIWYDETSDVPVISCVQQKFTTRQYETTNIDYLTISHEDCS